MANKKLSSWANVKDYLKTYIDSERDWDKEEISDYSVLQKQGLSADQRAEGKTLLQQYLADADADSAYKQARVNADNEARRQTALQDYLYTRLSSYMPILQSNSGQKGYNGLTEGQAVALHNTQAQAQQDIHATKEASKATALSTYLNSLRDNSATAIDQLTSIDTARETKQTEKDANLRQNISDYLGGTELNGYSGAMTEDGVLSESKYTELQEYLKNNGASDDVLNELELLYKNNVKSDEHVNTSYIESQKETINAVVTPTDLASLRSKLSTDDTIDEKTKAEIDDLLNEREKEIYKTVRKSGLISTGSTFTIKVPTGRKASSDGTTEDFFVNNDTTVTVGEAEKIAVASSLEKGQAFLYNGKPYIKGEDDKCYHVRNYAGYGAYERLQKFLEGGCYDFKE